MSRQLLSVQLGVEFVELLYGGRLLMCVLPKEGAEERDLCKLLLSAAHVVSLEVFAKTEELVSSASYTYSQTACVGRHEVLYFDRRYTDRMTDLLRQPGCVDLLP